MVANKVKQTKHHLAMLQQMRAEAGGEEREFSMLRTEIPNSPRIDEIASDLDMDGRLSFDGEGMQVFASLAQEVLTLAERAPAATFAA